MLSSVIRYSELLSLFLLQKQVEPLSTLTNIWSLNPQLNSSKVPERQSNLGFPTKEPVVVGDRMSAVGSGRGNQFLENTYDLFQDKSIWGIAMETPSANTLPWAQLKSTDLLPADQD